MKKHILVLGLFLVISAVACSGGSGGGVPPADVAADQAVTDMEGADVVVGAHAYLPPPLTLQAYTVVLETSATVAAAGQAVELSVRTARGAAAGALSYTWELDGAVADGDAAGPDLTVSFPEAGRFAIGVTVTDGNGDAASAGVLIQVYGAGETF